MVPTAIMCERMKEEGVLGDGGRGGTGKKRRPRLWNHLSVNPRRPQRESTVNQTALSTPQHVPSSSVGRLPQANRCRSTKVRLWAGPWKRQRIAWPLNTTNTAYPRHWHTTGYRRTLSHPGWEGRGRWCPNVNG